MTDLARTPQQIGNLVRRARKKRDLSQTQLADLAGVAARRPFPLSRPATSAARLETILAVLAPLDLEFRIVARGKASSTDIEDIF